MWKGTEQGEGMSWKLDRCQTHGGCNCYVLRHLPSGQEVPASMRPKRLERKMHRIEKYWLEEQRRLAALREKYE
jgi:hypothetical protein